MEPYFIEILINSGFYIYNKRLTADGFECFGENPSKKEKNRERMRKRNPMKNKNTVNKMLRTTVERHGRTRPSLSEETKRKQSISKMGHNNPMYSNTSASKHLNQERIMCPFCKKEMNIGNAKRWHFDKCKQK